MVFVVVDDRIMGRKLRRKIRTTARSLNGELCYMDFYI